MRVTGHFRYLLVVASICAFLCCVVVALTMSAFYYRHSTSFWEAEVEHQFNVRDQSADIVFIGDSSLVFGVSPEQIQQQTGWSAYSLGVPAPAFAVAPDLPDLLIRHYLENNRAPRLVVLYLTASTRSHPPYVGTPKWYEGETTLIRHGEPKQVVSFFSSHTDEITRFLALAAYRAVAFDWTGGHYRDIAQTLDHDRGFFPHPTQLVIKRQDCTRPTPGLMPDRELIQRFRHGAAEHGISSAVYLAPMPDCDGAFAQVASSYSQLVDNTPYTLPHGLFLDDFTLAHLASHGAAENSKIVAAFMQRITTAAPNARAHSP